MKKILKVVFILSVIIIMMITFTKKIFATVSLETPTTKDTIIKADDFLGKGAAVGTVIDENQLQQTSSYLYRTLMAIGIVVIVIVGTIIGIKFIIASADEKAKVKESLVPYLISCGVIIGSFTIWSIFVNIGQEISPTSYTEGGFSRTLRIY